MCIISYFNKGSLCLVLASIHFDPDNVLVSVGAVLTTARGVVSNKHIINK